MNTAKIAQHKSKGNVQFPNMLGILGGTFDPIHYGHLKPVIDTAQWLGLSKVLLLPAHIPPHKQTTFASAQQRNNMVKLACKEHPLFSLDTRESNRNSPSYTSTTLNEIKQQYPTKTLCFFMGMDSLLNFTSWYNWQEILTLCHLVINARPGYDLNQVNNETKMLLKQHQVITPDVINKKNSGCILITTQTQVAISSTELRKNLAQNLPCQQFMPTTIIDYIKNQQLYL